MALVQYMPIFHTYIHTYICNTQVRKEFPDHIIMAGNVVTGEMTEELILSGADIVKVRM